MFTKTDDAEVWQYIEQARTELVAYLDTLSDEQWNHDSLCDGWKVRDVLAHLILEYHYSATSSWKDLVRAGFNINTFMKQTAIKTAEQPASELIRQFRSLVSEQRKPGAISVMNVLVDLLVHEQDIRIPLNQPKNIDVSLLKLVFSHWEPAAYNFGEKITGLSGRLKDLKFIFTDLEMSKGTGAEVTGTAQDILMAAVGRTITLDKLTGDGAVLLRSRLQ